MQLLVWSQAVDTGTGTGLFTGGAAASYTSAPTDIIKIGDQLFMAAVTLEIPVGQTPLLPTMVYYYNVTFAAASGTKDLKSLGLLAATQAPRPTVPLGYEEGLLPSFILCATTLENISVAHGSCRKPHGLGRDGLAVLDFVVEDCLKKAEPLKRPQQLFLTGDQIYADDVAAALLHYLTPLGNDLIGKAETVTVSVAAPELTTEVTLPNLPPFSRQRLLEQKAFFTSGEAGSHLLAFGEFCAMYLLSWSTSAWPDELMALQVPTDEEAQDFVAGSLPDPNLASFLTDLPTDAKEKQQAKAKRSQQYRDEIAQLITFRDTLPRVRRVLANVPSYMIMDDHEITDDWYLTLRWRRRVLTNPLGVSILRNGLLAYALFQDWGNNPKDYVNQADNPNKKKRLLALIPVIFDKAQGTLPAAGPALNEVHQLLGFAAEDDETEADTEAAEGSVDSTRPIRWHYWVRTGPALTFVLDTRSRRGYERLLSPPALLSEAAFKDQIPKPTDALKRTGAPPLGPPDPAVPPVTAAVQAPEAVLVVSAAPVLGLAALEELAQPLYWGASEGRTGPDYEAWAFNPPALEQLLARLAPFKRVVLLSGDVHFGSSVAMDYWKKADLPATGYDTSRIIQLVSSACKNQADMLPDAFFVSGRINQLEAGALLPARRLGWKELFAQDVQGPLTSRNKIRLRRTPALLTPGPTWAEATVAPPADWGWQFAPAMDERPEAERPEDVQLPPLETDDLQADPAAFYPQVLKRHMEAFKKFDSRRYVWLNNIGTVAFKGTVAANDLRVEHTLWHYLATDDENAKPDAYTLYSLSLIPTTDPLPTLH